MHFYPHCSVLLNGGCHECVWRLTRMHLLGYNQRFMCHLPHTHVCVDVKRSRGFSKKRQDFLIFATHAHACMHWEYHITFKRNSPIASAKRPDHPKFSDAPNTLMCAGSSISAPSTTICALGHGVLTFHNTHVCVRTDKPSSQFRGTGLLAHRST